MFDQMTKHALIQLFRNTLVSVIEILTTACTRGISYLPNVHHVTMVTDADRKTIFTRSADTGQEVIEVRGHLHEPSLLVSLPYGVFTHLGEINNY